MDIEYLLWLQGLREAAPDFVNAIFFGLSWILAAPVPLVVAAVLMWCIDKRFGYLLGFNFAACTFVNSIVKVCACVYRPWVQDARVIPDADALVDATGYSFPSGHVAVATSFYGTFAERFKRYKWVVVLAVVLILLSSLSRSWLGCHTPQDVLASLGISVVVMIVVYVLAHCLENHPAWDVPMAAIVLVAGIAFVVFCQFKGYPVDYDAAGNLLVDPYAMQTDCYRSAGAFIGLALSWLLERRVIKYEVTGSVLQRIVIAVIGLAIVGLLYGLVLPQVFGLVFDEHYAKFFKYLITVVVVVAAYPACIMAWRRRRDSSEKPAV